MIARPQPLGVLPLPAGWLVWPAAAFADPAVAAARDALLTGRLPDPWPVAVPRDGAEVDAVAGPEHAYN
ncbi:MAG: hypothetical protein ACFCUP_10175, partial [Actinomycetales bacterium]